MHTNTHFSWSDRHCNVLASRVLVLLHNPSYLFSCQRTVCASVINSIQFFYLLEPKRTASRESLHTQSTQTSGHAPSALASVSALPMDFHTSPMASLTLLHHPQATTGLTRWLSDTITETRTATPTTARSASAHGPLVRDEIRGHGVMWCASLS